MRKNIESGAEMIPSAKLGRKEIEAIDQQFGNNPFFRDPGEKDLEYFRVVRPDGGWFNIPKHSHLDVEWEDGKNERVKIDEVIAARLAHPDITEIRDSLRAWRKRGK